MQKFATSLHLKLVPARHDPARHDHCTCKALTACSALYLAGEQSEKPIGRRHVTRRYAVSSIAGPAATPQAPLDTEVACNAGMLLPHTCSMCASAVPILASLKAAR